MPISSSTPAASAARSRSVRAPETTVQHANCRTARSSRCHRDRRTGTGSRARWPGPRRDSRRHRSPAGRRVPRPGAGTRSAGTGPGVVVAERRRGGRRFGCRQRLQAQGRRTIRESVRSAPRRSLAAPRRCCRQAEAQRRQSRECEHPTPRPRGWRPRRVRGRASVAGDASASVTDRLLDPRWLAAATTTASTASPTRPDPAADPKRRLGQHEDRPVPQVERVRDPAEVAHRRTARAADPGPAAPARRQAARDHQRRPDRRQQCRDRPGTASSA